MKKSISKLLRECMKTNNMNLEELKTKIGISRATLYKILNVTSYSPSNSVIEKIANYLDCDIEELGGVRNVVKNETHILHNITNDKTDAINAAKDFEYGDDVCKKLEAAKTLGEINRIMCNARYKKFG